VPGSRREEVALLAGISIEYYTGLERGNARGVSDEVLEGLARARQLDEVERAHLVDYHRSGVQPFHHPLVGDLTPNYDALELPADPGQTIVAHTAQPDSPAPHALDLLASWTLTPDQAPAVATDHDT
jgi:transcriptional regulator with XRE-family HTH domain